MGFRAADLSVLAYANNFTQWHYTTPDTADKVLAENYFNQALDMFRKGDFIIVNPDNVAEEGSAIFCLVAKTENGEVVIHQYK